MRCIKCNTEVSNSLNFCPNCGIKIIHLKEEKSKTNNSLFYILILGFLFLILLLYVEMENDKQLRELQTDMQKQIEQNNDNLRCQEKCYSADVENCKKLSCKYNIGMGCFDLDPDKMTCVDSTASENGDCFCKCNCDVIIRTFEIQ